MTPSVEILKEKATICTAQVRVKGKWEKRNIILTKELAKEAVGHSYILGDPCKPKDSDAPPASPGLNDLGVAEVFERVCKSQLYGETSIEDIDKVQVDLSLVKTMSMTNAFYPMECVPAKLHH
jgi:hypothetical protein